jgi:hypothetical protein
VTDDECVSATAASSDLISTAGVPGQAYYPVSPVRNKYDKKVISAKTARFRVETVERRQAASQVEIKAYLLALAPSRYSFSRSLSLCVCCVRSVQCNASA